MPSLGVQLQPKESFEVANDLVSHIFATHVLYLCYSVDNLGDKGWCRPLALKGRLEKAYRPVSLCEQIGQRNFSDDIAYAV